MESFAKQHNFDKCLDIFLVFMKETHSTEFNQHRDVAASTLSNIFQSMIGSIDQTLAGKSLQELNIVALTNMKGAFLKKKKQVKLKGKVELIALNTSTQDGRYVLEYNVADNGLAVKKIKCLKLIIPMERVDARSFVAQECESVTHVALKVMDSVIPFVFETSYRSVSHRIHTVFSVVCDEFQEIEFHKPVTSYTIQILRPHINVDTNTNSNQMLYLVRKPCHAIHRIERNTLNSFVTIVISQPVEEERSFVVGDTICIRGYALIYTPSLLHRHISENDVLAVNMFVNRQFGHEVIQVSMEDHLMSVCIRCSESSQTTMDKTNILDVLQANREHNSIKQAEAINVSLQPCCIVQTWLV